MNVKARPHPFTLRPRQRQTSVKSFRLIIQVVGGRTGLAELELRAPAPKSVTVEDIAMAFEELPLANPEREAHALELFRLDMTPDEYAARFGHQFAMFSFDDFRYSRPGLTEWVQRVGDIFFRRHGAPTLRELRERFLTPAEIEAAERYEKDPF